MSVLANSTHPSGFHGDLLKLKYLPQRVDVVFQPHNLYEYGSDMQQSDCSGEMTSCVGVTGARHGTWARGERWKKAMCRKSRHVFFRGVATVVTNLFNIVEPDVAVFAQKAYQQLRLIQQMASIESCP